MYDTHTPAMRKMVFIRVYAAKKMVLVLECTKSRQAVL
jgi:hypothetical protein